MFAILGAIGLLFRRKGKADMTAGEVEIALRLAAAEGTVLLAEVTVILLEITLVKVEVTTEVDVTCVVAEVTLLLVVADYYYY